MAALSGIPSGELTVFLISMLPVLELRGGLLSASWLQIPLWRALPVCICGNLLPIPFILLLIRRILAWMKRFRLTGILSEKVEKHALNKSSTIQSCEFWGLFLFVGIPLPGTGAWTGALIAALLGIPVKRAFPAIALGVLLSAGMMSFLAYGILELI